MLALALSNQEIRLGDYENLFALTNRKFLTRGRFQKFLT